MEAKILRGILYFTPEGGAEFEIGLVQKVSFSVEATETKVMDKSQSEDRTFDIQAVSSTSKLTYETKDVKKEILAQALRATSSDITYEIGEELPDGSTATAQTVITRLSADPTTRIVGKFRFVSTVATADGTPQLTIPKASVKATGSLELINDDFVSIPFEGEAMLPDTAEKIYYLDYM